MAGEKSVVRWERTRTACETTTHRKRARPRRAHREHEHLTALGHAAEAVMESAPEVAACWLRAVLNTFPPEQRGGREHTWLTGLLDRALTLSGNPP
ncbi:hypothetical protein [Streptosporangium saharense]|uniref:Uncharacterized protein n=1 Tax=Streptosporangium saharense TaxID=1706840 RepID=A0A7W7VMG5_9ACTN|nr:hypothetical protein [Streptosporangium saharense]MBB4915240.1 hypothetical protein [Streptosporangium saharense]